MDYYQISRIKNLLCNASSIEYIQEKFSGSIKNPFPDLMQQSFYFTYIYLIFVRKPENMDTKLTLSLDKKVIERAKKYAKKKNISLSKLIEAYLNKASSQEKDETAISPLVKSLSGVIKLPKDFNHKRGYSDYLSGKYQKD